MSDIVSTEDYNCLVAFKEYANTQLKEYIRSTFGADVYANYISLYFDDMMECIEDRIEDLAAQSIEDEEFEGAFFLEDVDQ